MSATSSQERDGPGSPRHLRPVSKPNSPAKHEVTSQTSLSPTFINLNGSQMSSERHATSPPTSPRLSIETLSESQLTMKAQEIRIHPSSHRRHDDDRNRRARSMPLFGQSSRSTLLYRRSLSPALIDVPTLEGDPGRDMHTSGPSIRRNSTSTLLATEGEDELAEDSTPLPSTSIGQAEVDNLMQWVNRPPSPIQRSLRTRKPAQLAPYTTEMQRYKRRLMRNDWQDAVVVEKEFLRAQREKRREREENGLSPVPGEELEKRQRIHAARRSLDEDGQVQSRKAGRALNSRVTPLREIANKDLFARYGGPPSSSSEDEELQRETAGPSRLSSTSSSTSSQVVPRKRINRALLSETESSIVEVHEISDDSDTQNDESDDEQAFIVIDEEEDQNRDSRKERLTTKDMRYYKQQLKLARRTMPMAAAKRCIEDLMLMHKERKERGRFHESPEPEGVDEETANINSPGTLRPGESRTRIAQQREEGHGRLIDDADEESDDSDMPSPVSSGTEAEAEDERSWMYDEDLPNERWLHSISRSRRDDIDEMLTSATRTNAKRARAKGKIDGKKDGKGSRQTTLFLQGRVNPVKSYRKEKVTARETAAEEGRLPGVYKTKHKRRKGDINTTIRRIYTGPSTGQRLLENPPIAQVRRKPRFSLLHDASLFEGVAFLSPADTGSKTPLPSSLATPSRISSVYTPDWQLRKDNRSPASRTSSPLKASRFEDDNQQQRVVSPGQRIETKDHAQPALPRQAAAPAPLVQKRLELQTPTSATSDASASPAHIVKQNLQMDIWQDISDLRLDFGLRPPPVGLCFHADTLLGKGQIFELLQLAKGSAECIQPRSICVFDLDLTVENFDGRELQDALESAKGQLIPFLQMDGQSGDSRFRTQLSDLFRFTLLWISAAQDETKARSVIREARILADDFIAIVKEHKATKGSHHSTLLQALRWFKVELGWREACQLICKGVPTSQLDEEGTDWQAAFVQACQDLMLELLIHGLHHTLHSIKRAGQAALNTNDPAGFFALDDAVLTDQSAQYWIGLIHLLSLSEACNMVDSFTSFWSVFEAATKQYQKALSHAKSGLLVAENGWYSIMAISCLSHFSASTGASTTRTFLKGGHWPMVMQSLSHVRLRANEQVEIAMPRAALQMRDNYIRLILCRVHQLHTVWSWSFESCEATLGKLFALFDTHKLEDLPTEANHDFPSFLCLYDESRLLDAVQEEDTAFHIFIKILAKAAFDLRGINSAGESQADRNIARLLSRFSPLRTMTFNRELPPTTLQRSALYNHYSIALVYLYLVPASHHQRLLQIQQYLSFSKADDKSQLVCIRAMMYAITALQHHSVDIKEAVGWFKGAFKMMLSRLEELHRIGASSTHLLKWEKEIKTQKTLLIAALRSLQYVIKMESLDKHRTTHDYPNVLLVDATWTASLLQSNLALQSTTLTLEVFHLLQAFLARRLSAVALSKKGVSLPRNGQVDANAESQDSFADLFDDVDFDDALLLDAAGYKVSNSAHLPTEVAKQEKIRKLDREFALHLHTCISPAIFQLLSNLFHPARKPTFSMARIAPDLLDRHEPGYMSMLNSAIKEMSKTTLAETIIDTWAMFAWIMVEELEVRQWSHYFNYGLEDPKRLQGEVAKRDVNLHFLLMISSNCLTQNNINSLGLKMYETNLIAFWSCFMASLTSRNLTSQHLMCNNLRRLEWNRDEKKGGLLQSMDWQDNLAWTIDDFERHRLILLGVILTNFSASWNEPNLAPKSLLFASLTSLLVSVRIYITEDKNGRDADHIAFCKTILQCCKEKLSETLLRGIASELRKTTTFLEEQSCITIPF